MVFRRLAVLQTLLRQLQTLQKFLGRQLDGCLCRIGLSIRQKLRGILVGPGGFRQSDLLLMPSLSEGMPVAGLHALAMGLALVLSRVGGCVDLVQDGVNGYLLDPSDQAGFERALRDLLGSPQRLQSFRLASREHAQRFNLEMIIAQYEQILENAVNH